MIGLLDQWIPDHIAMAITWTLIHSIWQIALVGIIIAGGLKLYKDDPAIVRYRIAKAAIYMIVCITAGTFFIFYMYFSKDYSNEVFTVHFANGVKTYYGPNIPEIENMSSWSSDFFYPNSILIPACWLLGVFMFAIRFLGGNIYTRYIVKTSSKCTSPMWAERLASMHSSFKIKKAVQLRTSKMISSPMVIGYLKPCLLLPLAVMNHLDIKDVEAILAHELAHIKRNDYLQNLILSIVEVMFYYHPVIWWLSYQVKSEREHCCDDMAVAYMGNSLEYASSLVKLEELSLSGFQPSLAMTLAKKGSLMNRICRILNQPQNTQQSMFKFAITCMLCMMFAVIAYNKSNDTEPVNVISENGQSTMLASHNSPSQVADNSDAYHKDVIDESKGRPLNNSAPYPSYFASVIKQDRGKITVDTLPKKLVDVSIETGNYSIKIDDGDVKKLIIDGEKIDEKDYDKFIDRNENGDIIQINGKNVSLPEPPPPPKASNFHSHTIMPNPPSPPRVPLEGSMDKGKVQIQNDEYHIELDDGTIKKLKIDGKRIDKDKYEDYVTRNEDGDITEINGKKLMLPELPDFPDMPELPDFPDTPAFPEMPIFPEPPPFPSYKSFSSLDHIDNNAILELERELEKLIDNGRLQLLDDNSKLDSLIASMKSQARGLGKPNHLYPNREKLDSMLGDFERKFNKRNSEWLQEFKSPLKSKRFTKDIFNKETASNMIISELWEDEFFEEGMNNKMELTDREMKINGEKQPSNIHRKYKRMYEDKMGHPLTNGSKIIMESDERQANRLRL